MNPGNAVITNNHGATFKYTASQHLHLIKTSSIFGQNATIYTSVTQSQEQLTCSLYCVRFEDAFSREGQLEERLHLKIDDSTHTTSGASSEESSLCTEGSLKTRTRVVGIKKGILEPMDVQLYM